MKALIIHATRTGNTTRVAEAVADGMRAAGGSVEIIGIDEAPLVFAGDVDLVVIGGPTEGHSMTPQMEAYLDRLPAGALDGRAVTAFDTRVSWPKLLSGSAADRIRDRLTRGGARLVAPVESFIVSMKPEIRPEELERARAWGHSLAGAIEPSPVAGLAH